jgi:hypothetical protein
MPANPTALKKPEKLPHRLYSDGVVAIAAFILLINNITLAY